MAFSQQLLGAPNNTPNSRAKGWSTSRITKDYINIKHLENFKND